MVTVASFGCSPQFYYDILVIPIYLFCVLAGSSCFFLFHISDSTRGYGSGRSDLDCSGLLDKSSGEHASRRDHVAQLETGIGGSDR